METLASPSSCRVSSSSSSSSSSFAFGRDKTGFVKRLDESCFLRSRRASAFGLFSSIFVHHINPVSPLSCLSPKAQVELSEVNFQTEEKYQLKTKTVHVRFQLEKECLFGQQFLMVGDDPIFGLWDPKNAVPLTWSDQHVWFAELDIPIGKSIQYKFILKDVTGEILWQPGVDRVFQSWETENIIIVSDDWENAEFHVVTEEERNLNPNNNNSGMVLGANVKTDIDEPKTRAASSESEVANQRKAGSKNSTVSKKNVVIEKGLLENNGKAVRLVNYEGEPVLVPGLPPLQEFSAEGDNGKQVDEKISLDDLAEAVEAKDHSSTETQSGKNPERPSNQSQNGKTDERTDNDEPNLESESQQKLNFDKADELSESEPKDDSDILVNDLQWGQKTLQKFLTNLGFF